MSVRPAAVIVTTCLCLLPVALRATVDTGAIEQTPAAPPLTRPQRDLLGALVTAVDRSTSASSAGHEWQTHVLRASDGSHYIATSVVPITPLGDSPLLIYVRLATSTLPGLTTSAERSVVREWLQGSRTDPRLLPRRGMAVGDMPALGAGASIVRGGVSAVGSPDLKILELERERSRQRKEEEEKRRRTSLEGAAAPATDRFPFEDFEIGRPAMFADGTRAIQRALTAAPGTYDLFLAWVDAREPAAKATVHVASQRLQLAPAGVEFALSTVIVADRIGVQQVPYSALDQRAHPYVIGATEILPARDTLFTPDERLSVAFQIVNPAASASGKPDVRVELRIMRMTGTREEPQAALSPLIYNDTTLPEDFDVRLGHPLIAALSAPLATIPRGQYRLLITAEDRVAGTIVSGPTDFRVVGTPATLLAEAPSLGTRFNVADALQTPVVTTLIDRLAPVAGASAALAKALDAGRAGRFADLLIVEPVPEGERGVRAALTGLGLLAVGDLGAIAQFEQALRLGAAPAPLQFLLGAGRALQNRDPDAIAAWHAAREAGLTPLIVDRLLADGYLRRRDFARAAAAIAGSEAVAFDRDATRTLAATRIATRREAEAITALDAYLAHHPEDAAARWLLVHALYSEFVNGSRERRERLLLEARRYIDGKGANAALAEAWLAMVVARSP